MFTNYFSYFRKSQLVLNSSIRQHIYCKLYETINENSTPFKIPAQSQTRRLSIQIAVERIVNQWLELKLHFQVTKQSKKYLGDSLCNVE